MQKSPISKCFKLFAPLCSPAGGISPRASETHRGRPSPLYPKWGNYGWSLPVAPPSDSWRSPALWRPQSCLSLSWRPRQNSLRPIFSYEPPAHCWYLLDMNNKRPEGSLEIIKEPNIFKKLCHFQALNASCESTVCFLGRRGITPWEGEQGVFKELLL